MPHQTRARSKCIRAQEFQQPPQQLFAYAANGASHTQPGLNQPGTASTMHNATTGQPFLNARDRITSRPIVGITSTEDNSTSTETEPAGCFR